MIGLAVLIWTIKLILKKANVKNACLTVTILLLLGVSQLILIQMFFFGAWPTFIPHIATGVSIFIVTLQFFLNRPSSRTT
jgi:predicted membrane channel-forming protein YqfA (hemolysin III family)